MIPTTLDDWDTQSSYAHDGAPPPREAQKDSAQACFLRAQARLAVLRGGPGSGNYGHEGRPGLVGGSAPSDIDSSTWTISPTWTPERVIARMLAVAERREQGGERDDPYPLSITTDPNKTRFILPDGTRLAGKGEHSDLVFNALRDEASGIWHAKLETVMRAGIIRYSGASAQVAQPLTETQAQILSDDWNTAADRYPGSEFFLEVAPTLPSGRVNWQASTWQKFTQPFTADSLRHFSRRAAAGEAVGSRAKGGPGSGNHGHAGRPGQIGGSAPSAVEDAPPDPKGVIRAIWRLIEERGPAQSPIDEASGEATDEVPFYVTDSADQMRFLLPDGTRLGSTLGEHGDTVEFLASETGAGFWDMLRAGIVRVTPPDGVEIAAPLTEAQARVIADDWTFTHEHGLYVDAIIVGDTKDTREHKRFEVPISSEALRQWSKRTRRAKGGAGSGNFGHEGRPGLVGGSKPNGGDASPGWRDTDPPSELSRDRLDAVKAIEALLPEALKSAEPDRRDAEVVLAEEWERLNLDAQFATRRRWIDQVFAQDPAGALATARAHWMDNHTDADTWGSRSPLQQEMYAQELIERQWWDLSSANMMRWAVEYGFASSKTEGDVMLPKVWHWDDLNYQMFVPAGEDVDWNKNRHDEKQFFADKKSSKALANRLVELRTAQLSAERGVSPMSADDIESMWSSWKVSSTSAPALFMQAAMERELGILSRLSPLDLENAGGVAIAYGADKGEMIHSPADAAAMKARGWARGQAYVRAQWEATQFILDKSRAPSEMGLYRAVILPKSAVANTTRRMINIHGDDFALLPNLDMQRNAAASATRDSSVANSWEGTKVRYNGTTNERVVLRMAAPRHAIFSVPIFGKNHQAEREVVIAGTRNNVHWDAWVNRAPGFTGMALRHAKAIAQPLVIDLLELERGFPHWLSGLPTEEKTVKYSPDQPRDPAGTETGGQWTDTGSGAALSRQRLVAVAAVEALVPEAVASADFAAEGVNIESWDDISDDDQVSIYDAWKQSEIEDAYNNDIYSDVMSSAEQDYVNENMPAPDDQDLIDAAAEDFVELFKKQTGVEIDSDTIIVDENGEIDPSDLRTVDGKPLSNMDPGPFLPGLEASSAPTQVDLADYLWGKAHEQAMTKARENLEQSDGAIEARDNALIEEIDHVWSDMSDHAKLEWASEHHKLDDVTANRESVDASVPSRWVWDDEEGNDPDEVKSRVIANRLVELRNEQIAAERDAKPLTSEEINYVWDRWKGSSTSTASLGLHIAVERELGVLSRLTDKERKQGEKAVESIFGGGNGSGRTRIDPMTGEWMPIHPELKGKGMERLQAYVRAQWETTQFLLDKGGTPEIGLYRAVILPKSSITSGRERTLPNSDSYSETFTELPSLKMQRNAVASTTRSIDIANSWNGVGGVHPDYDHSRVVLRLAAPRHAILSVPIFGKNEQSEREVVAVGTRRDLHWEAFLKRAPRFDQIPLRHAKSVESDPPGELVIDLLELERGQPHWLSEVRTDRARVVPSRRKGGPGSGNFGHEGRPGQVGGSKPSGTTSEPTRGWHLTSDPRFVPDPTIKPDWNSLAGDMMPEDKIPAGLFVGDPEYWMHAFGYERPYVAEIEGVVTNPPGTVMHAGKESFMQGDMKTVRVLTIDEYCRETYHEPGWVESYFSEIPERTRFPKDYVGRPVSEMTDAEIAEWERKFAEYARRADGPNPSKARTKALFQQVEGGHNGFFVGCYLDADAQLALARPGGEPASELHITLAYCEDVETLGDVAVARAVLAVQDVAQQFGPMSGMVTGVGQFPSSEASDGRVVIWAKPKVTGLPKLREALAQALTAVGVPPKSTFKWTPHITLLYQEPSADGVTVPEVPRVRFRLEALTIGAGDRWTDIPLTGEMTKGGPGSGNHDHAGRPGQVGGSAPSDRPTLTADERAAMNAERKALIADVAPLLERGEGGLTADEARRLEATMSKIDNLSFDLARPLRVEKIQPEAERLSTLSAATVVVAQADLMRTRSVFLPIAKASAGVWFNADTPVDDVVNGKGAISPDAFRQAFDATRDAMRAQYGDTVTLYRAVGKQKPKATTNWATTQEFAAQFGKHVVSAVFPIEAILAVNVGPFGRYHEVIIETSKVPR